MSRATTLHGVLRHRASTAALTPVEEVDAPLLNYILGLPLGERLSGVGCRGGFCRLVASLYICFLVLMLLRLWVLAASLCPCLLVLMLLLRLLAVSGVLSCKEVLLLWSMSNSHIQAIAASRLLCVQHLLTRAPSLLLGGALMLHPIVLQLCLLDSHDVCLHDMTTFRVSRCTVMRRGAPVGSHFKAV